MSYINDVYAQSTTQMSALRIVKRERTCITLAVRQVDANNVLLSDIKHLHLRQREYMTMR